MTRLWVEDNRTGIPLVGIAGEITEKSGAELADRVMRQIHLHSGGRSGGDRPLSAMVVCVRAPRDMPS